MPIMKNNEQQNKQLEDQITADLFPLIENPKLRAYDVGFSFSTNKNKLLNQLSYELGRIQGSTWCNSRGLLITDYEGELNSDTISKLWANRQNKFKDILSIKENENWDKKPQHIADFGNMRFKKIYRGNLERKKFDRAIVERKCKSQALVINNEPYLAITISSPINYPIDLATLKSEKTSIELIGLQVKDRSKPDWTIGEIVEVTGVCNEENKSRLLSMTTTSKQSGWIKNSHVNTEVVKIKTYAGNILEYSISGLLPVISPNQISNFGLNQYEISKYQRISPEKRRTLISTLMRDQRIKKLIRNPINSNNSNSFFNAESIGYNGTVLFGQGHIGHISNNIREVKKYGFYKKNKKFLTESIKISILNGIPNLDSISSFTKELQYEINSFGFNSEIISENRCNANNYSNLERAIIKSIEVKPDLIITILPDKYSSGEGETSELYQSTKHLTVNKGVMNQVISKNTISDFRFKISNIALSILAKVGNVPWVLSDELNFCDMILGVDISREKKVNSKGTRNDLGVPRWYSPNGDLLNYKLPRSSIEGERINKSIIREITPAEEFSGKNILLHADGKRPFQEIDDFLERGEQLGGEIFVVEVIKSPSFRIYRFGENGIIYPKKGDGIKISDHEATIISTLPQHSTGTPNPLHIRCSKNMLIEDAVLSVLQLTDLHYSSQQQPRCPVTTHDAHQISNLLRMNVRPPDDEGVLPWWL